MKRICVLLSVLLVAYSCMTGCAAGKTGTRPSSVSTTSQASSSATTSDATTVVTLPTLTTANPDSTPEYVVSLSIVEADFTSDSPYITVEWRNTSDSTVMFGGYYDIQRKQGENLVSCATYEYGWDEIAYELPVGGTQQMTYRLSPFDLSDLEACYYLIAECSTFYFRGGGEKHRVCGAFYIGETEMVSSTFMLSDSLILCSYPPKNSLAFVRNVKKADVTHLSCTAQHTYTFTEENVASLMTWIDALQYEHRTYEEGCSPGDVDGGSCYAFTLFGDSAVEFMYKVNGKEDHYLLIDGKWYEVFNPSLPPLPAT